MTDEQRKVHNTVKKEQTSVTRQLAKTFGNSDKHLETLTMPCACSITQKQSLV